MVYVTEKRFARRLMIDIANDGDVEYGIVFDTETAAEAVGKIAEAWTRSAMESRHGPPYLPDLMLEHAAEWGLQ